MKKYSYRTAIVHSIPDITKTCCDFGKDGWKLSQSIATKLTGDVGISFILIFEKDLGIK